MIHNRTVATVTCLHFGADFLQYAMRSVSDDVEQHIIMYSFVPNHGHFDTSVPCPETHDQLAEVAFRTAPDKTRFFGSYDWKSEGEQFMAGWPYTDADVIVKLDADEVYPPGLLADAIAYGIEHRAREIRLPLIHMWRSFYKGFTHDPAAPGRIYLREFESGEVTYTPPDVTERIWHYGYSLPVELMRYKVRTHGHLSEFRKDCDWLNDVYIANRQYDCHPIGSDYWMQTEDIIAPVFMMDHPFAEFEVIP